MATTLVPPWKPSTVEIISPEKHEAIENLFLRRRALCDEAVSDAFPTSRRCETPPAAYVMKETRPVKSYSGFFIVC